MISVLTVNKKASRWSKRDYPSLSLHSLQWLVEEATRERESGKVGLNTDLQLISYGNAPSDRTHSVHERSHRNESVYVMNVRHSPCNDHQRLRDPWPFWCGYFCDVQLYTYTYTWQLLRLLPVIIFVAFTRDNLCEVYLWPRLWLLYVTTCVTSLCLATFVTSACDQLRANVRQGVSIQSFATSLFMSPSMCEFTQRLSGEKKLWESTMAD